MEKVTITELCKAFQVSKTTITNWVNRVCPHEQTTKGKIFVLSEVIKWHQERFLKTESGDTEGLTKARAMKEHFRALMAELVYRERSGELVPAEAVKTVAFEKARMLRDQMLNIPSRLSPILAAERDPQKIHELLNKEIRQILEALSHDLSNDFNQSGSVKMVKSNEEKNE